MSNLLKKINNKEAVIGVIGLGYVGLPLAIEFANEGYKVIGIDLLQTKVDSLKQGKSYIIDVKDELIKSNIEAGKFMPTTDFSKIGEVDAVSIAVPTPLQKSKDPDISYITSAMNSMKDYVHKDMIIVLESTTYPGTTRELIANRISEWGCVCGILP